MVMFHGVIFHTRMPSEFVGRCSQDPISFLTFFPLRFRVWCCFFYLFFFWGSPEIFLVKSVTLVLLSQGALENWALQFVPWPWSLAWWFSPEKSLRTHMGNRKILREVSEKSKNRLIFIYIYIYCGQYEHKADLNLNSLATNRLNG